MFTEPVSFLDIVLEETGSFARKAEDGYTILPDANSSIQTIWFQENVLDCTK